MPRFMTRTMPRVMAAAIAFSLLALPAAGPASAFPIDPAPRAATGSGLVEQAAFRHIGGFHRGGFHRGFGGQRFGGFRHGFGGRRFYGGGRYYGGRGYGGGYGVGAGIAGLAAGAIIGGVIAGAARANNAVSYCESRFKSYDPATGTYLGYDGLRHRCP